MCVSNFKFCPNIKWVLRYDWQTREICGLPIPIIFIIQWENKWTGNQQSIRATCIHSEMLKYILHVINLGSCGSIRDVNIVPIPLRNWPMLCFYIFVTHFTGHSVNRSAHCVPVYLLLGHMHAPTFLIPIKIGLRELRTDFSPSSWNCPYDTDYLCFDFYWIFIEFRCSTNVHKYVIDSSFPTIKMLTVLFPQRNILSLSLCAMMHTYLLCDTYVYQTNWPQRWPINFAAPKRNRMKWGAHNHAKNIKWILLQFEILPSQWEANGTHNQQQQQQQ